MFSSPRKRPDVSTSAMPPPASRRLSLLLMPRDADRTEPAAFEVLARWAHAGFLPPGDHGSPSLVEGGCASVRAMSSGVQRFLANRQGGFSVRCPASGVNLVPTFVPALTAWRRGGPRYLGCVCAKDHDLVDLEFAPAAGFAFQWVELFDVDGAEVVPEALALAAEVWGGVRMVGRRG